MRSSSGEDKVRRKAFLTRLARDKRGNTLVMGAAAMIPLAGMVGGGLDVSRLYITKTRLQHACDAGALAGRRTMGAGAWANNNGAANTEAMRFFNGNWETDAYGSRALSIAYSEDGGVVTGQASVILPMTLMRIFGREEISVDVSCSAEQRLLNTDVMFVLDTTGSMNDTISGDSQSKLDNLKVAVKCFYEVLSQLDISGQDCDAGVPSGGISSDIQLRFGFVPYSNNVNVGRLLSTSHVADRWPYQTRQYLRHDWGDWYEVSRTPMVNGACPAAANTSSRQYRSVTVTEGQGQTRCRNEQRDGRPIWRYARVDIDVSGLKNGSEWREGFTHPQIGDNVENQYIPWNGCIEERETVRQTNYIPLPAGARDLDAATAPDANVATQWGPQLPNLHFWRNTYGFFGFPIQGELQNDETSATSNLYLRGSFPFLYACPTAARRLRSYQQSGDPADFAAYVNGLQPAGMTYHDIGMLWGQRLAHPRGIFATDNALTPSGGRIDRHIVFMTDGDTQTTELMHSAYGVPWFDRRQTDQATPPTAGQLNEQVDKRFEALCRAGKNDFTIWVVGFGPLSDTTLARLQGCASPGRFFRATNGPALQRAFRDIAEQIGQLRLVQ